MKIQSTIKLTDETKLRAFLKDSIISFLLEQDDTTDIFYNGNDIYAQSNLKGRYLYKKDISNEEVDNFIRQICNLTNNSFSFSEPILDTSFLNYRLNATYIVCSRKNQNNCITFALRILKNKIQISNNGIFYPKEIHFLLLDILQNRNNIVIAGSPGSGKTEFQKYLISLLKDERVITIDSINELDIDYQSEIDITHFITNDFQKFCELALRYGPDYLILAETRGKEIAEIITAILSGVTTITTLHAKNIDEITMRCADMYRLKNNILGIKESMDIIENNIDVYIYLDKVIQKDGTVLRYIKEILSLKEDKKILYRRKQ